jgi:hypothetical protein
MYSLSLLVPQGAGVVSSVVLKKAPRLRLPYNYCVFDVSRKTQLF